MEQMDYQGRFLILVDIELHLKDLAGAQAMEMVEEQGQEGQGGEQTALLIGIHLVA